MDPFPAARGAPAGIWWPYTTNLTAELPALVAGLTAWLNDTGHELKVRRITVNLSAWTHVPTRTEIAGQPVRITWSGTLDPHITRIACAPDERTFLLITLLVLPPDTPYGPGRAAMARGGGTSVRGSQPRTQTQETQVPT
ncbi:DUF5994 family protein [Actinocatenispora rupis]|uniref:Uncharacterized protein n=2 Tax=Actinocatenispora rupis TaxID=519421 RepID=A0A8J3J1B1_9ACTN|nr:hypothetical protein Aru02nite_11290 [Actinocatenispora rupis]